MTLFPGPRLKSIPFYSLLPFLIGEFVEWRRGFESQQSKKMLLASGSNGGLERENVEVGEFTQATSTF